MTNPFVYLFVQGIKEVITTPHLAIPVLLMAFGMAVAVWLLRGK